MPPLSQCVPVAIRFTLLALTVSVFAACGPSESTIGGNGKADAGFVIPPPPPPPPPCTKFTFYLDADGDGFGDPAQSEFVCQAPAGHVLTGGDCDDADELTHPGAPELLDDKDNSCDGKIDLGAPGKDFDGDGYPGLNAGGLVVDCDDEEPLVGPGALEVPGDGVDNNCDGQIDEAIDCEAGITATGTSSSATAAQYVAAIGMCGDWVQSVQLNKGNAASRAIRKKLGNNFTPQAGEWMLHLSSGSAKDKLDQSSWTPQPGSEFNTADTHPLWSPPPAGCGNPSPANARDLSEITLTLKVPSNARSFSFQVNFFSAEYPEWVCSAYNDRFIALLSSSALDPSKLPGGSAAVGKNCITTGGKQFCNVSFDSTGQPLTVNNGFFDICVSAGSNTCTKPASLLTGTGYENNVGGATGWLTTKAPVTPGETITLRFAILDEGDWQLDSAVLIDNFKWDAEAVEAPTTEPIG